VNSLLPAWMKELEDLKKTIPVWMKELEDLKKMLPHRAHSDSLDRQRKADTSTFLPGSIDVKTKVLLTSQLGIPIEEMTCPQCSSIVCLRVPRRGWRDFMWRLKRCFPWSCRECGHRFYHVRRR